MGASPRQAFSCLSWLSFWTGSTYQNLERESSKYWHYSPAQLFAISGFARSPDTSVKRGLGRSVLLPYKDEIIQAWQKRQSAKTIAESLNAKGIGTTPQNVWKFIQRHSQ